MCSVAVESTAARRVLLVEDVQAMRLYLRLSLEQAGYQVLEASTLSEARALLRAEAPLASVLLDLELPDGHGLDIVRDIPAEVPVLALTADDSSENRMRCRQAGCAEVLSKTGNFSTLARKLADLEAHSSGNADLLKPDSDLLRRYESFLCEARIELQLARKSSDVRKIRRIAHRLSGTAVHFGFNGIGNGARVLTQAIHANSTSRTESALDELVGRLLDVADSV